MGVLFFWGHTYSFIIPYTALCSVLQSIDRSLEMTSKLQIHSHREIGMMERPKACNMIFQFLNASFSLVHS